MMESLQNIVIYIKKIGIILTLWLLPVLPLFQVLPSTGSGEVVSNPMDGLFIIRSVQRRYDPVEPWAIPSIVERTGMAVLIGKDLVFTDLELVRDSASITVTNPGNGMKSTARVRHAGFDSGLAILELEHPDFYKGFQGYELAQEEAEAGDEIRIGGLGKGSTAPVFQSLRIASVRRDLLDGSDVDNRKIIFPVHEPVEGNFSGGPVLKNNKLIGIFHTPIQESEGRRYIISTDVIAHMVQDISDGVYDGYPVLDIVYQPVDNPSFRKFVGLEGAEGGLYVNRVARDQERNPDSVLYPGDVITRFNGLVIAEGGLIRVKENQLSTLAEYLSTLQAGSVPVEILRMGRIYRAELPVGPSPRYARMRTPIESRRKYYVNGGLVFQELDRNLVVDPRLTMNPLTRSYRYNYSLEDGMYDPEKADIVLTSILDDIRTSEYGRFAGGIVRTINGSPVKNLKEFVDRWKEAQSRYIRIDFLDESVPLVLERESVDEINRRVEVRYRLQLQEDGREG